jgi:hypothetical protein
MFAQLRDVLPAEDSTVVAEKDDHRGGVSPQSTQTDRSVVDIRDSQACQLAAERFPHAASFSRAVESNVKRKVALSFNFLDAMLDLTPGHGFCGGRLLD